MARLKKNIGAVHVCLHQPTQKWQPVKFSQIINIFKYRFKQDVPQNGLPIKNSSPTQMGLTILFIRSFLVICYLQ